MSWLDNGAFCWLGGGTCLGPDRGGLRRESLRRRRGEGGVKRRETRRRRWLPRQGSVSLSSRMTATLPTAIQLKENFVTPRQERGRDRMRERGGRQRQKLRARLGNLYQRQTSREFEKSREKIKKREGKMKMQRYGIEQRQTEKQTETMDATRNKNKIKTDYRDEMAQRQTDRQADRSRE